MVAGWDNTTKQGAKSPIRLRSCQGQRAGWHWLGHDDRVLSARLVAFAECLPRPGFFTPGGKPLFIFPDVMPHIISGSQHADEVAVLVHGTFAGDNADQGNRWWQHESEPAKNLQQRFPSAVRVARGSEVFHWSGKNGERARNKAGTELLNHLQALEKSGQPYHLIGHSHGGSVIWNALRRATFLKRPLQGLRSWTTVGTPFLHQFSRNPWNVWNILYVAVALVLVWPTFKVARLLAILMFEAVTGKYRAMLLPTDAEAGVFAIIRTPILATLELLGVDVHRTTKGIQIGSFDPDSGMSFMQYLFFTSEGLTELAVIILCFYIFLHLAVMCLRPVIESFRIRGEVQLERRALALYGDKWLGMWTPDDEAINGLKATLDLSLSFVKKLVPRERIFMSDNLMLLSRPYFWALAPIFNRLLRPQIDAAVCGLVIRSAQGNDRPTAQIVAVGTTPTLDLANQLPPLPEAIGQDLLQQADQETGQIVPRLRQLLADPTFVAELDHTVSGAWGKTLVHTLYFDHPGVLDLIALHVAWGTSQGDSLEQFAMTDQTLLAWFHSFKAILHQRIVNDGSRTDSSVIRDARPTQPTRLYRKAG